MNSFFRLWLLLTYMSIGLMGFLMFFGIIGMVASAE